MTSQAERTRIKKQSRRIAPVARRTVTNLPPPQDRDGLLWLIKKKGLTLAQIQAAKVWRDAVRNAGGVSIRSCINDAAPRGDGAAWQRLQAAYVGASASKAWLEHMRQDVLRGQVDMLTVMDGVCGAGRTLRELAGGHDRRAGGMEAVLRVALDLFALDQVGRAARAA